MTSSRDIDDWERVRTALEAVWENSARVDFDVLLSCGWLVGSSGIDERITAWLGDHLCEATLDAAGALLTGIWAPRPGHRPIVAVEAVRRLSSIREPYGVDALYSQAQALARVRDDDLGAMGREGLRSWRQWMLSVTAAPHLVEFVTKFLR